MDSPTRQDLFEQMAALLAANGTPVNADIHALMEPLLSGSMSYDEHRAWLKAMIAGIES